MISCDLLICGAGPVGCTIAELASSKHNLKSVIVEKRNHISGNCYDEEHSSGILIHKYGPHYFRAKDKKIFDYMSKFTDWIDGDYIVNSYVDKKQYEFPINLNTLEMFFKVKLDEKKARELLDSKKINIPNPSNAEEALLSIVGTELYENFYKGYTKKQWGVSAKFLDPSVVLRVPIRFNRNHFYVDEGIKKMPKKGYNFLFTKMTDSENIKIMKNTNFVSIRDVIKPKIATVYTGPVDEYFDFKYGKLEWRSLDFDFKLYDKEFVQSCVQINYPNDYDYTRSVEIKHVTKQKHNQTVVSYEYPKGVGEPYYPVINSTNQLLYNKYKLDADKLKTKDRIYFAGRLAEYKYINIDHAIDRAIQTFNQIEKDNLKND